MSKADTPDSQAQRPSDASEEASDDFDSFLHRLAATPVVQPELPKLGVGTLVGERYRVDAEVGAGGMGTVFRATDIRLGRPVALKVHRRPEGRPGLELLRVEARALAHLTHPNVVEVYEIGAHEDRIFIAMEYVPGGTLESWQKDRPPREIVEVYLEAGEGLVAAHREGLVHRDFKPANVLVGRDGRPRVADFGLVLNLSSQREVSVPDPISAVEASDADSTRLEGLSAHAMVGTPRYMAPEQAAGHGADHRADQYALCSALFEALSGDVPPEPIVELPSRKGVPKGVWKALRRGLAVEPSERFPDLGQLLEALRTASRPRPWVASGVAMAVAAAALVSGGLVSTTNPTRSCERDARATVAAWRDPQDRLEAVLRKQGDDARAAAFGEQLDTFASAWLTARETACGTGRDDRHRDAVMRCLGRHADALEGIVDVVASAPPTSGAPVRDLPLPALDECTPERATTQARPTLDTAMAASVDEVLAAVEKANAFVWSGELDAARTQAQAALRQAHALQHKPTLVTALMSAGDVELEAGRLETSHSHYEQGFYLAQSLGLNDEAALAAASLIQILQDVGDYPAADRWANHALSAFERLGEDAETSSEISVLSSVGNLRSHQGRYEEALEIQTRLLATLPDEGDEVRRSKSHNSLGATLANMGELGRAIEHFEISIALNDAARGPHHPDNVYPLANLAWMLIEAEELDRAEPLLDRAIKILQEKTADDTYALVTLLSHRGALHDERGEHEAALEVYAQGLALAQTELGDEHALAGMLLNNQAASFEATGEIDRARETYAEAVRVLERDGNPDDEILALARSNLAKLSAPD